MLIEFLLKGCNNFSHSGKWIVVDCCSSNLYFITASGAVHVFCFSIVDVLFSKLFIHIRSSFLFLSYWSFSFQVVRISYKLWIITLEYVVCVPSTFPSLFIYLLTLFGIFLNQLQLIRIDMLISHALQLESI